jgi:hypothetical protein
MGEHLHLHDDDFWTVQRFRYNRGATTDPDNNDDATQDADGGYQAGSLWFNTSTGIVWICNDATIASAVWSRIDIDDHGELDGLGDDDHTQYLKEKLSGGTAAETPVHTHASEPEAGLLRAVDIPITDPGSLITATEVEGALQEHRTEIEYHHVLNHHLDGTTIEATDQTITEAGGTVSLNVEQEGGGDITALLNGETHILSATPPPGAAIALVAGTDTVPQLNYVYIVVDSPGVAILATSTTAWPTSGAYAAVATVLVQSAASVALYGPYKHHMWADHIESITTEVGHLAHVNAKLRALEATWVSGVAASALIVADPDAHFTTDAGVVFQLHPHAMPARDVSSDGLYILNDPTTANLRVITFDGITQDASGGVINNKWFPLVVWGVVSENEADCKLFINLPTDTYVTQASALADSDNFAVYQIPADYVGTGFLIAKYVVQGKSSGAWVEATDSPFDLRGLLPAISPGAGTAITDHGGLSGLGDDDHTQYPLLSATPGGELGGTYAAPTVDATHSGTAHHTKYTDGEVDAIVATHTADADAHQDAPGLIATHTAIATAHQDAPGLIATHATDVDSTMLAIPTQRSMRSWRHTMPSPQPTTPSTSTQRLSRRWVSRAMGTRCTTTSTRTVK